MTDYDTLFDDNRPTDSVFKDKSAFDSLSPPEEIHGRSAQKDALASILSGIHDGYLPNTVSIYGPPGTGKTATTRRVTSEFVERTEGIATEYVNLKECRTLFSAANEIHVQLTGEKRDAYVGLDGVFEGIWDALEAYPEWTVLILDEVDHIQQDQNYDPSEFFYRLLRGEGKLAREINLSVWLLSNELLEVDLSLDSRVRSAMEGEEVFFPPYDADELRAIVEPRLATGFVDGAISEEAVDRGIRAAADRWGDARQTLRLFRRAGELANDRDVSQVTEACIADSLRGTEREQTIQKLRGLPRRHQILLTAAVSWRDGADEIVQPIRVSQVQGRLAEMGVDQRFQIGDRAIRNLVEELETMGLVETWIESEASGGRVRYMQTAFDPEWMRESQLGSGSDGSEVS